jgi:hypothetical protein
VPGLRGGVVVSWVDAVDCVQDVGCVADGAAECSYRVLVDGFGHDTSLSSEILREG